MSSERRNSLSPPERKGTVDPGAHELDGSDTDEHYSDAHEAPAPASPIPRLRVERVDDKPAYGEVPGTEAYRMREEDAEPDEIALIPDPDDQSDGKAADAEVKEPRSPGGHPIPMTVVEETPDSPDAVTHHDVEERHKADPSPDLVVKADGQRVENGDSPDTPISPTLKTPTSARSRRKSSLAMKRSPLTPDFPLVDGDGDGDGDDEFGDDFDDFEEGEDMDDGDFGDFDDGFQQADEEAPTPVPVPAPAAAPAPPQSTLSFPIPDFDDLDASEIFSITQPYLNALFPSPNDDDEESPQKSLLPHSSKESNPQNPIFLTQRSASLWSQLVAPPPLQPPDWIRSRIRRLFLVSLGVPVDLDEILPASSKQKKLVLPSLHRATSTGSLRTSSDSRSRSVSRVRGGGGGEGGGSDVDSQGRKKSSRLSATGGGGERSKRSSKSKTASGSSIAGAGGSNAGSSSTAAAAAGPRKGPPPEPQFDLVAAKQLCRTTDEALGGMTDAELKAHIAKLEAMEGIAGEVLVYWQQRTDQQIGEREAFEGVIENLVKHARKVRK